MSDTTVSRVRDIASHLNELSDSQIEIYIADAELELPDSVIGTEFEEKAQRYLTAHLATIDVRRPKRENKLNLTVSYDSEESNEDVLNTTKYGKEYKRVVQKVNSDSNPIHKLYS